MYKESHGQDSIIFIKKPARVVQIINTDLREVKYKLLNNPDGPVYVVRKKEVKYIRYTDGRIEDYSIVKLQETPSVEEPADTLWKKWYKGHNAIYISVSDLLYGFGTIKYERSFARNRFGIKIPFSLGMATAGIIDSVSMSSPNDWGPETVYDRYNYFSPGKIYSTGVEIYYYPGERKEINYFVGLAFGYGQYEYWAAFSTFIPTKPIVFYKYKGEYYSYFFKNGIMVNFNKHLNISVNLGMGSNQVIMTDYYSTPDNGSPRNDFIKAIEWGIDVGYAF